MTWSRWYAAKSYMMSTMWLSPLVAFVLAQLTYRVPYVLGIDLGAIPGFVYTEQGKISALDINITMNLTFIVFTFGSMLVAIQIASAQLSPRIIATVLLRDNVIRIVVGLFAYGLVISLGARNRTETIPNFVISIAALWGLVSVVAFLFLIDHAARLLRPLTIVRRMAEQGLKVFADVYPKAAGPLADVPRLRMDELPKGRTIAHAGKSGVILAVNTGALVAAAARFDGIVELVPQVGDFVATGRPLLIVRGGNELVDDRRLANQVAFGPERTIEQDSMFARRAIELDFDNPVAHATLAWITGDSGQHDLAVRHAQRALAISPNEVSGLLSMGRVLTFGGRADEALDPLLSAVQRSRNDPFGSLVWATLAVCHYFRRDFDACAEISRRMLRDFPEFTLIHKWLAASLGHLGSDDASEALQEAIAILPTSFEYIARQRPPWFRPDDHALYLEGLTKAGWKG